MTKRQLRGYAIWLLIHITQIVVAAWILFGFTPAETYKRTIKQFQSYKYSLQTHLHYFFDASARLGDKANKYGLQEANDVRAGKDRYSGFNKQIDQEIRNNFIQQ
jgi:hypothetical protein